MLPEDLYSRFRAEVRDEATPQLWTSDEVWSYMDDAQKMFCRETGGIADSTSALTILPVTPGAIWVPYDPRILKLRALTRSSDFRSVDILNFEDLGTACHGGDDYGQYHRFRFSNVVGPLSAVVVGMEANQLRLSSPAQYADTITAIVYRMPLLDLNEDSTAFEIDPQHHLHLLNWMKHLAHKKQDAETYDRGRSDEFAAAFLAYCDRAKHEREQREHKYRTVAYGGY